MRAQKFSTVEKLKAILGRVSRRMVASASRSRFEGSGVGDSHKTMSNHSPWIAVTDQISRELSFGWCWFHSPRAVSRGGLTYAGAVIFDKNLATSHIGILRVDHASKASHVLYLEQIDVLDDHNAPSILWLDEERFLITWTLHGLDCSVRVQVWDMSERQAPRLESSQQCIVQEHCSYTNLFKESDQTVFIVTRSISTCPTIIAFDLVSRTFGSPKKLFSWSKPVGSPFFSSRDGGRPYVVFCQDADRWYFALTEDHPRAYRNGVYSGYIRGRKIFDLSDQYLGDAFESDGYAIPFGLTEIHGGHSEKIPWVLDIFARSGHVSIGYQIVDRCDEEFFADSDRMMTSQDSRYVHARVTGDICVKTESGHAGMALYSDEADYRGGMAISRVDMNSFVMSTDVHPLAGTPESGSFHRLFHGECGTDSQVFLSEIFDGETSGCQMRPVYSTPTDDTGHSLLWLAGDYVSYSKFDLKVMTRTFEPGTTCLTHGARHADSYFSIEEPVLPEGELQLLTSELQRSRNYLEFGSGGSTLTAARLVAERVVTVDSDRAFQSFVELRIDRSGSSSPELIFLHGNLGPTTAWGYPLAPSHEPVPGGNYVEAAAQFLEGGWSPDLVLIDGRYRVACFAYLMRVLTSPVTVLFDDYFDRPHYHVVEQMISPARGVGRMAVFEVTNRPRGSSTAQMYGEFLNDPR